MKTHLIYSNNYDFAFWGLSKLHPFDGNKFSKAWEIVASAYQDKPGFDWIMPKTPVSDETLLKIHTRDYLSSLRTSATVAGVIEVRLAKFIPNSLLQTRLIMPIRLACTGSLLATEAALKNDSMAMNFGGGFHHAFADHGEGFCFFADAALSILNGREKRLLGTGDKVLMIDLDAHRGNGFEALTGDDASVKIFDMYSFQVYPGLHSGDPDEYPYMIPLKAGMKDDVYLGVLETYLEKFLNENSDARLVFYNAGNDILEDDPLGGLSISFEGVVKRDQYVIGQLAKRKLPTVIMTSGGYTRRSHQLIAELAKSVITLAA